MPLKLPGVRIESQHRARVQIVAGPEVPIVVGPGVAGAPVNSVGFGIVGAGVPGGYAARLPGVSCPGSEVRFARLRNRVEAPETFSSGCVISIQKSGNRMLAARHA